MPFSQKKKCELAHTSHTTEVQQTVGVPLKKPSADHGKIRPRTTGMKAGEAFRDHTLID